MIGVEARQAINPSELKLSRTEADKRAFTLMAAFKVALHGLDEYKVAASDVSLNISGDQSKNVDKPRTEIEFGKGDSTYRVTYSFSAKEQSLMIIKETLDASREEGVFMEPMEIITLKSRRFIDQKSIRSAEIKWYRPVSAPRVDDYLNPQVNTAFAVEKALGVLEKLSSQK